MKDRITMTYTNKDVERLVAAAKNAMPRISQSNAGARIALAMALAPFEQDPDAEVIEEMVKEIYEANYSGFMYRDLIDAAKNVYRKDARAALAAYRKHTESGDRLTPEAPDGWHVAHVQVCLIRDVDRLDSHGHGPTIAAAIRDALEGSNHA